MIEQCGVDNRQRGYFWGPNELIRHWAPLIGLDGIGLLNTYDVWCDRRDGSPTRGFAFPTREQESTFYGVSKSCLAVITVILEAVGLLDVEVDERITGRGRGGGGQTRTQKNFYRLVDRDWTLTVDDVIAVLELADQDARVFRRIYHIFKADFGPIDGKNNPWSTILPAAREHPLWSKLEARAQERAASYSKRRRKGKCLPDNRRSLPVTAGSSSSPNQRSLPVTAGSPPASNRQSLPVTTGKPAEPTITISDGKHVVEEAEEDVEKDVFQLFASLAGQDDYQPSERDRLALASLYTDGYAVSEIAAGIQRAVAGARARNTTPHRFTYCVPAVQDVPPANPSLGSPAGEPTPAMEQAAVPVDAAPLVAPSGNPAATPDPLRELCCELDELAQQRGLELSPGVLRDLANLTLDFDVAATRQRSTGRRWVEEALKRVDSRVESPARYVRAILEDWKRRGCEVLPAAESQPGGEDDVPEPEPSPSPFALEYQPSAPLADRWERVLDELKLEMTAATFNTWFQRTRLLDLLQADEATIWRIEVHTTHARDWIEARLCSTLERVVGRLYPDTSPRLEFVVPAD